MEDRLLGREGLTARLRAELFGVKNVWAWVGVHMAHCIR